MNTTLGSSGRQEDFDGFNQGIRSRSIASACIGIIANVLYLPIFLFQLSLHIEVQLAFFLDALLLHVTYNA